MTNSIAHRHPGDRHGRRHVISAALPPCRIIARLGLVLLLALLTGCANAPNAIDRGAYHVDRSHTSTAYDMRVRFIVLHYTSSPTNAEAFADLLGPHVSSHYLVGKKPRIINGEPVILQLVDEKHRAWHAGHSAWRGRRNLNDTSIGIEIVNTGPLSANGRRVGWAPYGEHQIKALTALLRDLIQRYNIKPKNIVGHADIAPSRKIDPGPRFPWKQLARAGIGAWPNKDLVAHFQRKFRHDMPDIAAIQRALSQYGYAVAVTGEMNARTHDVLRAFQMHFRPAQYNGVPDLATVARLWALNAEYSDDPADEQA